MLVAALLNIIWLAWLVIHLFSELGVYTGVHRHAYAYTFIAGVIAVVIGSLLLKIVYFLRKRTRWVQLGFGLWLVGVGLFFIAFVMGTPIPPSHMPEEHILFNHRDFLVFLLGIIVSQYIDLRVIADFGPLKGKLKEPGGI